MKNLLCHTKFVNLFKISSFSSSHYSSISRFNHFTTITTSLKLKIPKSFIFQQPLNLSSNYLRNFRYSGIGSIIGVSVATASTIAYAMDAEDALVDGRSNDSQDLSEAEENAQYLWKLVGKFWWPLFFFVTILTNLDNPFTILLIKTTLFLLLTKPNPFSVYFYVDQLCQQSVCDDTKFFNGKSVYASKVEVQDYTLLCLADIEVRDEKFTLVGIFGTWWTLPSWEECSLIVRSILLKITEQGKSYVELQGLPFSCPLL